MGSELATIDAQVLRTMDDPPEAVLLEAKKAAQALRDIISQKAKPVMMNGEQYLEFEDWQTVGRFYGITAREDGDPEFVNLGGVQGFKASAVAVDRAGREIGRATAYCLNDEEKWRDRAKYAYAYVLKSGGTSVEDPGPDEIVWEDNPFKEGKKRPKKERMQVGTENVPLFQLSSMAQTRAGAKVLRSVLSWIVVLAGYRPTPAEEMDGVFERDPETKPQPARAPQSRAPEPTTPHADAPWSPDDDAPPSREPGEDEAAAYAKHDVEPPARQRKPAGRRSSGKPDCTRCHSNAEVIVSKRPENGSHYCFACRAGFTPEAAQ